MLENGFLKIAGFYGTMQNSVQPRFSRSIFHDFGKCEKHRPTDKVIIVLLLMHRIILVSLAVSKIFRKKENLKQKSCK